MADEPCRVYICSHVGKRPLNALVLNQRFAKLSACLHVRQRHVQKMLSSADVLGGPIDAARVKALEGDFETFSLIAEAILFGNRYIFEDEP